MDHCKMVDNGRKVKKICLWLCGEPGTGKTRHVHEQYPNHYKKKANKWANGYQGEREWVIEDLGLDKAKCLVDDLKIWADPWYNFPAETKGG